MTLLINEYQYITKIRKISTKIEKQSMEESLRHVIFEKCHLTFDFILHLQNLIISNSVLSYIHQIDIRIYEKSTLIVKNHNMKNISSS